MSTSKKNLATLVLRTLVTMGIAASAACASPPRSPSSLDGRVFAVEGRNLPPGRPAMIELSFAGGLLDSSACREQGLPPIAYTVREDGTFYAERRTTDTLDRFTGRVTGADIEGLYTSEHAGATTTRIPFKGRAR